MAMQIMENARRKAMSRLPQPAQAQAADAEAGTIREPRRPDMGFTDPPVPNPTPGPPQTPDYGIHRANLPTDPNSRNGGINPNPSLPTFGGNRYDPAYIQSALQQFSQMPGVDPSVGNDPAYWSRRINETGGLGPDNLAYWQDKAMNEWHRPPHGQQGSMGAGGAPLSLMLKMLASRMAGQAPSVPMQAQVNRGPSVQTPMVDINEIVRKAMQGY